MRSLFLIAALGGSLFSLGFYTDSEARGGGGGFHGGEGGWGRGGFTASDHDDFRSPTADPGPYQSGGHSNETNDAYYANTVQSFHGNPSPPAVSHPQSLLTTNNQPPHMPANGHPLPPDQHPTQPVNWHHSNFNSNWAQHADQYPNGYWEHGWYHGYWHNYWGDENWEWWGGAYGFWLGLDAGEVFVTEVEPGVCNYWNGVDWVGWYTPGITPYDCPY